MTKRHYWTAAELKKLRRLYPNMENGQIGERLGRSWSAVQNMAVKLGLKKDPSFLNGPACRFQKGIVPWNLGKTGYMGANRTSFRKGQRGARQKPVGSERIDRDGYPWVKVTEPNEWREKQRIVWEQTYGPVPAGYIVGFRDGNRQNCLLLNLELITRAENMRRNTYHRYPKEVARLIQLRGALNRQINKRAKREEQNSGLAGSPVRGNRKGEGRGYAARPGKDGRRAGAGNHQQRQGGNGSLKGARPNARNRVHSRGRPRSASTAAGAR